jgi:hypothetical protein
MILFYEPEIASAFQLLQRSIIAGKRGRGVESIISLQIKIFTITIQVHIGVAQTQKNINATDLYTIEPDDVLQECSVVPHIPDKTPDVFFFLCMICYMLTQVLGKKAQCNGKKNHQEFQEVFSKVLLFMLQISVVMYFHSKKDFLFLRFIVC